MEPERDSVLGDTVFPPAPGNKEMGTSRAKQTSPREILPQGANRGEQHLFPVSTHKIVEKKEQRTHRTKNQAQRGSGPWPQTQAQWKRCRNANVLSI